MHYLRQSRPKVLIVTLRHSSIVALWAKKFTGISTRIFVREAGMLSINRIRGIKGLMLSSLARSCYPWADGVIAVSEGVAGDIAHFARIQRDRIHTLYNPVVTPDLLDRAREPIRHPWFVSQTAPVILGAGRLNSAKGFDNLIQAFAELRQRREAKLMILGEGEKRAELEALSRNLKLEKDVSLPGFVPNPFAYMARASLFVLSSKCEGLPGVLIQAMACGCPVVSTDCPSGPYEILEGGRFGSLVEVGNVAALARAMKETLDSPLPSEVLKNRASDFSLEKIMPKYMEVLFPKGLS
jgi:glycosyltransferase involved in cell wall biosynthesis